MCYRKPHRFLVSIPYITGLEKMTTYAKIAVLVFLAFFTSGAVAQDLPVTQQCMGCLCEAMSLCNTTKTCSGDVCGPFKITWAYWSDSGKPTVNQESPESSTAYYNCATDTYCSALSVQGYMSKFQQDCDGNGRIDCDDFVAIHKIGGYGCRGTTLPEPFGQRYRQCKQIVGQLKP